MIKERQDPLHAGTACGMVWPTYQANGGDKYGWRRSREGVTCMRGGRQGQSGEADFLLRNWF